MAGQPNVRYPEDRYHDEMINKTIKSLWIHIACYVPLITLCVGAYLEPLNTEASESQMQCFEDYKLFLLICGFSMLPSVAFILYIVKCRSRHSHESVEKFAGMSLGLECVIFSALYIYKLVLSAS